MFVVLQALAKSRGGPGRFRAFFKKPQPELVQISVPGGAPFHILRMPRSGDDFDWKAIRSICGGRSSNLIVTPGINFPEDSGVSLFTPSRLPKKMLINHGAEIIRLSGIDPLRLLITVIDREGIVAEETRKLVHLASTIRVVTDNVARYTQVADKIMEDFGASIIMTDVPPLRNDITICVDKPPLKLNSDIVFSLQHAPCRFNINIRGIISPKYHELIPPKIDPELFFCALYELCGAGALGSCECESFLLNGRECKKSEIAASLAEKIQS